MPRTLRPLETTPHDEHFPGNSSLVAHLSIHGHLTSETYSAFVHTDRRFFVPRQLQPHAYCDIPLHHPSGIIISQPSVIASTIKLLDIKPGAKILEIGTGTGYQASLISFVAGPKGKVTSIENNKLVHELAKKAVREALKRVPEEFRGNVELVHADGSRGWKASAPYDAIVFAAQTPAPVARLVGRQLKEGGNLVAPISIRQGIQLLMSMTKRGGKLVINKGAIPVSFIPLEVQRKRAKK
ncbi:MAG TPA: hypothetical protein VGQ00_04100 [Candidatus Norongarragalinales archaeon]|jgi:protein-L-isoaspartate(D-aspartate) O-methyltransferase|nr:hypothetical protein [Candidatus Norongarragalinales archaeon]